MHVQRLIGRSISYETCRPSQPAHVDDLLLRDDRSKHHLTCVLFSSLSFEGQTKEETSCVLLNDNETWTVKAMAMHQSFLCVSVLSLLLFFSLSLSLSLLSNRQSVSDALEVCLKFSTALVKCDLQHLKYRRQLACIRIREINQALDSSCASLQSRQVHC